jgi:hypothetical protein
VGCHLNAKLATSVSTTSLAVAVGGEVNIEGSAHSAFAHSSFLAFPNSEECIDNPLYERISGGCERFGLGLVLFEDVANWDTYDVKVAPKHRDPDPHAVNDFIKNQISDKNREEIQRWFR